MSSRHLPAEMLDHIVDHLHDTEDALRNCCLVSKSWVPRARKHLFAVVEFPTSESSESWKEMFPDPSISPVRYAKTLFVGYPLAAMSGSWVREFSCVERLELGAYVVGLDFDEATPLLPFHGFSPVIKSLRVVIFTLPPSQIFNLILSFPLLEDLAVIIYCEMSASDVDNSEEDETPTATQPPTPFMFTGSLELHMRGGIRPITRRLLSLPGGIHFRKLTFTCFFGEDLLLKTALVEECSHTLESLDITLEFEGMSN
jgi:hypothetical protein